MKRLYFSLCPSLFVCLSVFLSVSLSAHLSVCLSILVCFSAYLKRHLPCILVWSSYPPLIQSELIFTFHLGSPLIFCSPPAPKLNPTLRLSVLIKLAEASERQREKQQQQLEEQLRQQEQLQQQQKQKQRWKRPRRVSEGDAKGKQIGDS